MKKLFALVAVFMFSIAGFAQDKITVTPPKAEAKECTAHHKKACCSKDKAMASNSKACCSKDAKTCCKGDKNKTCSAKDKAECAKDKKACCKLAAHDAKCSKEKKAACCAAKKKEVEKK